MYHIDNGVGNAHKYVETERELNAHLAMGWRLVPEEKKPAPKKKK